MKRFSLLLGIVAVAAMASVFTLSPAFAGSHDGHGSQMAGHMQPAADAPKLCEHCAAEGKANCPACKAACKAACKEAKAAGGQCPMMMGNCSTCKAVSTNVPQAQAALDKAIAALQAGKTDEALAHLQAAQKLLKDVPVPAMKAAAGPVNSKCPIMGSKLGANVPAKLTRTFNGKTVGFCCGGCPGAWDKLTDAQKAEKLDKAL